MRRDEYSPQSRRLQRGRAAGRRPLAAAVGAALLLATSAATAGPALAASSLTTATPGDGSTSTSAGSPSAAPGASTVVKGTLVRAFAEAPESAGGDRLLTWVQTPTDAIRVPTSDTDVTPLPTGSTVRVALGGTVSDATSRDGGEKAHAVLGAKVLAASSTDPGPATGTSAGGATAAGSVTTTHHLTIVMAVPAGGTQDSTTLGQVVTAATGGVEDYWNGASNGRIHLEVTKTVDWVHLSAGCSNPVAMWNEAAADAGWTPASDSHLVVYLSSTPASLSGCSDGLAEVGSGLDAGGRVYVRSTDTDVLAHELGHNFGLMHAAEEQCDGVVEGTSSQCRDTTYRDLYDIMAASWGPLGALSGFQATQLGFMADSARREVSPSGGSGVVSLAPVGASSGVRAVRLRTGGATYWIEDREAVGRDAYLSTSANWVGLKSGVVVRREGDTDAGMDATELLDATPSARSGWDDDLDVVLPVGTTVALAGGSWHVTVRSRSSAGAVVDVRRGSAPSVSVTVTRRSGTDRYATAAAVATASYPSGAPTVVVASGATFPDALAAAPAAAAARGPLLLVPATGDLPDAVRTALTALHPAAITVVGGRASVSDDVAGQLAAVAPVTRVSGADRYATAATVATGSAGTAGGSTVYLASGTSFPDALAGATAAARTGARLLLVSPTGLPDATAAAVRALAPDHVVALGGAAAVPDAVLKAAGALSPGAFTTRWSGADRYATAAAVAAQVGGATSAGVVLASGERFPDALAAAPLAGLTGQPLLLTQAACAPTATVAAAAGFGASTATVVGGTSSVSDDAAALTPCS